MERLQGLIDPAWSLAKGLGDFVSPEPVTVLVLCLVGVVRLTDKQRALQPWRRARRASLGRWWRFARTADARQAKQVASLLDDLLRLGDDPGDRIAIVIDDICSGVASDDDVPAYRTREFEVLHDLATESLDPRHEGLLVRYMLRERWMSSRSLLLAVSSYCSRFRDLQPVAYPDADGRMNFADQVSALTGATVVGDLSTQRAGVADQLLVWHQPVWRGRCQGEGRQKRARFGLPPYELYRTDIDRADRSLREYNGRVPTLERVEVCQRRGSDGTYFVVHTAESDYYSTEPLGPGRVADANGSPTECKKLAPAVDDPDQSVFVTLESSQGQRLIGARRPSRSSGDTAGRSVLLNGKLALISNSDEGPAAVFMLKSDASSNAARCLAPASGGVVELNVGTDRRHADRFGAPDYLSGIREETLEELGLRPDEYSASVCSIFLSNSRTRPFAASPGSALRTDTGELIATVLAVGTTDLGPEAFRRHRIFASPSRGLYESDALLFVPMGASAEDFSRNLLDGHFSWPDPEMSKGLQWRLLGFEPHPEAADSQPIAAWLDQAGLVAALYASNWVFGPGATARAFHTASQDVPWWSRAWPGLPPGALSRICRPPASLLRSSDSDEAPFNYWVSTYWGRPVPAMMLDSDVSLSGYEARVREAFEAKVGELEGMVTS